MITLFDPTSVPFRGLRTALDPSAVGLGYFTECQNLRFDSLACKLRGGITQLFTGGASGTCVGSTTVTQGSNTYVFTAQQISASDVRIYYFVYSGSWAGSYAELTQSTGKYGNTRMNAPASGFVTFTPVYGKANNLCVIVQNGVDDPRVIDVANATISKIEAIAAPVELESYSADFGIADNLDITAAATATNSGSAIVGSATGSPQYWQFATTSAAVSDTAEVSSNAQTIDLSASKQVWMVIEADNDTHFENCKWELVPTSGSNLTIHDPSNNKFGIISVETNVPGKRLYAFSVAEHSTASRTAIKGVKLTVQNTGVSGTIKILSIIGGGNVPGTASYSVCWHNFGTKTYSPGVVLVPSARSVGVAGIWGSTDSPLPDEFEIPISTVLYYKTSVPMVRPSSTDRDKGVDYVQIYRRDPGETFYSLVDEVQAASYSGSWAYTGTFSATRANYTDVTPPAYKNQEKLAPDAFTEQVPVGQASVWAGGRLYSGTYQDSSGRKALIKVSDLDEPFRFRSVAPLEETYRLGFSLRLSGNEDVRAFIPAASSVIGAASVYAFTSQATYSISGPRITKISSSGAISAAASENQNQILFIDQDKQVKRMTSSIDNLSKYRVQDILDGATSVDKFTSAYFKDRWYTVLTYGGVKRVLVWSDGLDDWESFDLPGVEPVQFIPWRVSGSAGLYFVDASGDIYQYESGNDDDGSQIALSLKTGDLHGPGWNEVNIGNVRIIATDKDSEVMTVVLTGLAPAASQSGTINLDSGSGQTVTYRYAQDVDGNELGVKSSAVNIKLSATLAGPFTLKGAQAKTKEIIKGLTDV